MYLPEKLIRLLEVQTIKIIQTIDSIVICAYGMNKDLVVRKKKLNVTI